MDNTPKNKPNIKILVACHKADPNIRQDDIYMPIQVGAALHPELDLGFQKDNEGENISEKNPYYCELTALYWAWKNLPKDVEYVGLAHYRRYFKVKKNNLLSILKKKGTIIIAEPESYPTNIFKDYANHHNGLDLKETYKIIKRKFINYNKSFEKKILNSNRMSPYNMFIMDRNIFNDYCKFIFDVLFELENKIEIKNYNNYQKRIYGFISERLLNVYIDKVKTDNKSINLKYCKVEMVNNKKNTLKELINRVRFNLSYYLSRPDKKDYIYFFNQYI